MAVLCCYCRNRLAARHRQGLCRPCADDPSIPRPHSKFANRGTGNVPPTALPEPTAVPPGPARVAVLEQRALAGQALWSPLDAHLED